MKTEWQKEKCASLPEEFQRIAPNVYLQRRNIRKADLTEDGKDGGYECDCRRISLDVYEALQEELYSPAYEATKRLLEDQSVALAESQLAMEYMTCLQELAME